MTPVPKPPKPVRGSAEAKRYMAAVAQLACACCGRFAVQVHHCIHGRYSQSRASDFDTIPLCDRCHRELHMCSKDTWRQRVGWYDYEMIDPTRDAVARIRSNTIGGRT